jgi:collagen type III alpha
MHARPPLENGFPPPPDGLENPERARTGGFPGAPNRPTVTPPSGPDNTASWPTPAGAPPADAEQSRFEQFKPEADEPAAVPATPATPHVRLLPVLVGVIIGACLLVGLAIGVVWLISRGSDNGGGFSVSAGDCVKRNGNEAVKATCTDADSYQVVSIADTKDQCTDPGQPYVLNPTKDGKTQVLCLKKNG